MYNMQTEGCIESVIFFLMSYKQHNW